MSDWSTRLARMTRSQQGQAYVEYAPIVLLVGIFLIVVVAAMGTTLVNFFTQVIAILGR